MDGLSDYYLLSEDMESKAQRVILPWGWHSVCYDCMNAYTHNSPDVSESNWSCSMWRILLTQGCGQRTQGPTPNLCDPDPPAIRWVVTDPVTMWASVWTVVKFSGEGFPNCIVCVRQLMSEASSSVQWRLFQLDIDGFFHSFLNPSILPVHPVQHIFILRGLSLLL